VNREPTTPSSRTSRLAGDLARSGSKPGAAVVQIKMRQPVYD
jgi:hypothetical protein